MKGLALILAVYSALAPAGAILAQEPTPPHDAREAFAFACSVMKYDCTNVTPPGIVWMNLFFTYGIHGGYNLEDVIYIDNAMLRIADKTYVNSVIAHEVTHYLDYTLGIEAFETKESACRSEFNGWRVGNAYLLSHGRADLVDYKWPERYGCFQ